MQNEASLTRGKTMISHQKYVVYGALIALLATPAFAADMALKAAPMAAPQAPTWTGFYIGLNAGAGWLRDPFVSAPGGTLLTIPFDGSLGWGDSISGSSNTSFTGGAQIGYNQQINNWVIGLESDLQYLGGSSNAANVFTAGSVITNSFSAKTQWFGTTRVRLGTTTLSPNLLVYVTGGFAYGNENLTGLITAASGGPETFPFSSNQTVFGYAVGGGGEWAFDRHWSVKAEYLFVQLGNASQQRLTTTVSGAGLPTDAMTLSVGHDNISVARGGINYRF
jgi:outer membrane immunogenic protein